jgi:hypothetical protein
MGYGEMGSGLAASSPTFSAPSRTETPLQRPLSTPAVQLQRSLWGDAGFRGSKRAASRPRPQSVEGPAWAPLPRRRHGHATATTRFGTLLCLAGPRPATSESVRSSRCNPSSTAHRDPRLDRTPQEVVLSQTLQRLREQRSGGRQGTGTRWTPRGQVRRHRLSLSPPPPCMMEPPLRMMEWGRGVIARSIAHPN